MTKPFVGRLDPPHYDYYLGDGVYATFDGYQVWLDCRGSNGFAKNPCGFRSVALNAETMVKLVAYEKEAQDQYNPPA